MDFLLQIVPRLKIGPGELSFRKRVGKITKSTPTSDSASENRAEESRQARLEGLTNSRRKGTRINLKI